MFPWRATAPAGTVEGLFAAAAAVAALLLVVVVLLLRVCTLHSLLRSSNAVHSQQLHARKHQESDRCFLPQLACLRVCVLYLCCCVFGPSAGLRGRLRSCGAMRLLNRAVCYITYAIFLTTSVRCCCSFACRHARASVSANFERRRSCSVTHSATRWMRRRCCFPGGPRSCTR